MEGLAAENGNKTSEKYDNVRSVNNPSSTENATIRISFLIIYHILPQLIIS